MNNGDFYNDSYQDNDEGPDFSYALERYKEACEEGQERNLVFSEEEFIYIIEYYISNNDEENVLKASEIAFEKHSYSSELLIKLADSLILTGNINRAVKMLEEYKDSFPQNTDILFLFCRAYIIKRDFTAARNYFSEILGTESRSREVAESVSSIGQDCMDAENYTEALYYLAASDQMFPLSYEYYNDLAFCYEKLEELDKARMYYNKFLDEDPFNDNVWFNLGTIYARQREFDKAIEAFEYATALNENNTSALYNLAVVYLNLERYREAVRHFRRFNELEPDNLAGVIGLADAKLGQNDLEGARESFERALRIDATCEEAVLGLQCISAIEEYLKGEKCKFLSQMKDIATKDATWVNTVYTILPQLGADGDFLQLLKSTKKTKQ